MPTIELITQINAPIEKVFDLSRSIDLHIESTKHTGERAIAGKTSGLIELGETVTWRARHFGIWQNLTSKITEFQYPSLFVDEMVSSAFKSFRHKHLFSQVDGCTVMKDIFVFESPLGILGKLANWLVLKRYMTNPAFVGVVTNKISHWLSITDKTVSPLFSTRSPKFE